MGFILPASEEPAIRDGCTERQCLKYNKMILRSEEWRYVPYGVECETRYPVGPKYTIRTVWLYFLYLIDSH